MRLSIWDYVGYMMSSFSVKAVARIRWKKATPRCRCIKREVQEKENIRMVKDMSDGESLIATESLEYYTFEYSYCQTPSLTQQGYIGGGFMCVRISALVFHGGPLPHLGRTEMRDGMYYQGRS